MSSESTFAPSFPEVLDENHGHDDGTPDTDLTLGLVPDDETDDTAPESEGKTPPTANGQPSAPRGLNRGAIRRIAAKAQEVVETDERINVIAAHLLGCGTGVADLTTAVMSAPRSATAPITDLGTIAEADPMEAGVVATEMGRDRIKAVWSLLVALDADAPSAMPAGVGKAAIAVAKAVFALDDTKKSDLESVRALLRKN